MNDALTTLGLAGLDKDRPMKIGKIHAPKGIRRDGPFVLYQGGAQPRETAATQELLRDFLALCRDVNGKATFRFTQKWGVLGLCQEHGLPTWHALGCSLGTDPSGLNRESLDHVRTFARGFEGLLKIGADFSNDRTGTAEDWAAAHAGITSDFPAWPEPQPYTLGIDEARTSFMTIMRRLLEICGVVPRFYWNWTASAWQIDLDASGYNIPGLLAIQFMLTVADKDGYAVCSACRKSYIPNRRPDPTRRNYCQTCGIKVAWRDSKRELRKNKRES